MERLKSPNLISGNCAYKAKRDLIATLNDKRGATAVINRSYVYNALNRPVTYTRENADGTLTVITADYDYMGRRVFKKVETVTPAAPDSESGEDSDTPTETRTVLSNHRFLYRSYLQIAALDLTRTTLNDLWLITWDPPETIATRPLAIQKDGIWYYAPARPAAQGTPSQVCSGLGVWLLKPHPAYGLDLPKNITEVYGFDGYIKATYTYSPYGLVTTTGNITQPLQWSSEFTDTDLGLVYYNYRHYNPLDGRWTGRDPLFEQMLYRNYSYCLNSPEHLYDQIGQKVCCSELTDADYGTCVRVKVKTVVRWALFGSTVVEWKSGASNAITKENTFRGYPEVILEATWMEEERCKEIKKCFDDKELTIWFEVIKYGYDGSAKRHELPGNLTSNTLYGTPHKQEMTQAHAVGWNAIGTGVNRLGIGLKTKYFHLKVYTGRYVFIDDDYYL